MCIALNPFRIGALQRIKYLDQTLECICSHDGVWKTTADDIAEYCMANYYEKVLASAEPRKARGEAGEGPRRRPPTSATEGRR